MTLPIVSFMPDNSGPSTAMAATFPHDNSAAPATLAARLLRRAGPGKRRRWTPWGCAAVRRRRRDFARRAIVWGLVCAMLLPSIGCRSDKTGCVCPDPWAYSMPTALNLSEPDVQTCPEARAYDTARPHTLRNSDPIDYWPLTLEEAIRIGLNNSRVLRDAGGRVMTSPARPCKAPSIRRFARPTRARERSPPSRSMTRPTTPASIGSTPTGFSTTFSWAAVPIRSSGTALSLQRRQQAHGHGW